ncbi:MAG: hypothetical protein PHN51_10145 [Candidatus Nanopelagicales bacterium]|nr:hypothetical protein [Candidatus Nanopelagicales bacterium]
MSFIYNPVQYTKKQKRLSNAEVDFNKLWGDTDSLPVTKEVLGYLYSGAIHGWIGADFRHWDKVLPFGNGCKLERTIAGLALDHNKLPKDFSAWLTPYRKPKPGRKPTTILERAISFNRGRFSELPTDTEFWTKQVTLPGDEKWTTAAHTVFRSKQDSTPFPNIVDIWAAVDADGLTVAEVAAKNNSLPYDFCHWGIPTSTGEHLVFTALKYGSLVPNFSDWDIWDLKKEFTVACYLAYNRRHPGIRQWSRDLTPVTQRYYVPLELIIQGDRLPDRYGVTPMTHFVAAGLRPLEFIGPGIDFQKVGPQTLCIAVFTGCLVIRGSFVGHSLATMESALLTMLRKTAMAKIIKVLKIWRPEQETVFIPGEEGGTTYAELNALHTEYTELIAAIRRPTFLP